MTVFFQLQGVSTQPGLQKYRRDSLLYGDNGGVLYLSDFAFPWSYAPGAPTDGKVIRDVAERADGSYVLAAGQTVTHSGGGLDYSQCTAAGSYEQVPASVLASLYNQQLFLVCGYFKLPTKADWRTGGFNSWLQTNLSANGFQSAPDLLTFGPGDGYQIRFYRQRGTGQNDQDFMSPIVPDALFGTVCQVAYWRTPSGQGCRIKGAAGSNIQTQALGPINPQNFSTQAMRVGMVPGFWSNPLSGVDLNSRRFRHYRTFVENLAISGRDPLTVLDADLARVLTRGVFS